MSTVKVQPPKAFVFDVFGTVVNWRQSLAVGLADAARSASEKLQSSGGDEGLIFRVRNMTHTDWEWFATEW